MLIGYVCSSPDDPRLDAQRAALAAAGCAKIVEERGSSPRVRARRVLGRLLDEVDRGDVLAVWRLDLLGRSAAHIVEIIDNLSARGVVVRTLSEEIDTSAPEAAMARRLIGALARFQRHTLTRGGRPRVSPSGLGRMVRKPRVRQGRSPSLVRD
jgi:DNA invertase Pin-like site-specific DNA recombinase